MSTRLFGLICTLLVACHSSSGRSLSSSAACEGRVPLVSAALQELDATGSWTNITRSNLLNSPWLVSSRPFVEEKPSVAFIRRTIVKSGCLCCETVLFTDDQVRQLSFAYVFTTRPEAVGAAKQLLTALLRDAYAAEATARIDQASGDIYEVFRWSLSGTQSPEVRQLMIDVEIGSVPSGGTGLSLSVVFARG